MSRQRSGILRNLTWTLPAGIVEAIAKAGAVILLARVLGPTEFGLVVLVLSIVAMLGLLSDLGLSAATARRLSEAPGSASGTLAVAARTILLPLMAVAVAVYLLAGWVGGILGAPRVGELGWLVASLLMVATARRFLTKSFEGLGRADVASKVFVAIGWTPWVLAVALVLSVSARAEWALAGHLAANAALVVALVVMSLGLLRRVAVGGGESTSRGLLMGYALPMLATSAGFLVYTQVDLILVQYFLNTSDVGVYGTAVRLMDLLHVPAAAVGASVAVYFVGLTGDRPDQAGRLFELVTRSLLFLYLPVATVLLIFGSDVVLLLFGPEYLSAGLIVALYVPFLLLKALSGTYSLALDYLGFATRRAMLVSVSAAANVALNLILIPRYGIAGAALATQVTYAPLGLYYLWLLAHESGAPVVSTGILRVVGATGVSGALTWAVAHLVQTHFTALVALFAVVYLLTILAARAVSRDEWSTLVAYTVRRGGDG